MFTAKVRATYRRCRDSLRRRSRRVSPRARRLRVPVHHRPSIRTERRRRRRGRRLAQTPHRPSHLPRDGNRPRRRRPRGPNPPRPSRPEAAPPARAPARSSETPRRGDARGACDRRASGAARQTRATPRRLRFGSASSARAGCGRGGCRRRRTRTRLLGRAWTCDGAARRMRSPGRATPRASVCVMGDFKVLGKEQQQPDTAWINMTFTCVAPKGGARPRLGRTTAPGTNEWRRERAIERIRTRFHRKSAESPHLSATRVRRTPPDPRPPPRLASR